MIIENNKGAKQFAQTCILVALTAIFIFPILLVFMNSFKSRLYVSTDPFALPTGSMFVGLENYIRGITSSGFFIAFIRSVWITVVGVMLIIVCTSMTAWFIVRVKNKFTKKNYYIFTLSMIFPLQMVVSTLDPLAEYTIFDEIALLIGVMLGQLVSRRMISAFLPTSIDPASIFNALAPL